MNLYLATKTVIWTKYSFKKTAYRSLVTLEIPNQMFFETSLTISITSLSH